MPEAANDPTTRLRRRRRALLGLPVAAVAWAGLGAVPAAPAPARAGTMHTETISLTGADAAQTAAVGSSTKALRTPPTKAAPGWSASIDVDDGTQALAASWQGAATGEVEVRGHDDDGWTEWEPLAADPADGGDHSGRDSGGMAWFGRAGIDRAELRVAHGTLQDLQVQAMRYEEPTSSGTITGLLQAPTAGAEAAKPTIQPRTLYTSKGWATANSGCSAGPQQASGGVKLAVVHHTVNSNTYSAEDVPAMLASIYAYHTGTNGWCDIAYNFIVDRFGRIWEGRSGGVDKPIIGGHAQGFNTGSFGVSFLGQFEPGASPTVATPSSAAIDAAARVIGWKFGLSGIDPTGTTSFTSGGSNKWPAGTNLTLPRVIGHRDVGNTACPGQNLYDLLPTIRAKAKAAQGGSASTTTTTTAPTTTTTQPPPPPELAPFRSSSALVDQQYDDVLRRKATSADLAYGGSRVGSTWTPGQFVANLEASSEADDRFHAVTRLYRAYFLRNPDHAGLTYWLNRRAEGRTLVSISASFAGSSEFTRRYGKLSNADFVDRVYQNVLGRPADANGLAYWKVRLDKGMSRGQVMANFSQSSEYAAKTQAGVRVVALYEALLQRPADPDVYALFEAGLRNGSTTLTSLATYVWGSDEYQARFS
ncbi:MAG: DUF4214 domain-containing protein [Acidimicrobiales bacterium]